MTFFDKLLNGENVLAPVIQYITDEKRETPISDIVDVKHTAQQHTRKRKTQAKDDNLVKETNTNDDNNSIEIRIRREERHRYNILLQQEMDRHDEELIRLTTKTVGTIMNLYVKSMELFAVALAHGRR